MTTETLNFIVATGTLGLQVVTIALAVLYVLESRVRDLSPLRTLIEKWALIKIFSASLFATLLALYYSDILGFVPCGWCWVQRIFLMPLPILTGLALWKKDRIADYVIALILPGLFFALYHHMIQMGGHSLLPCPISGEGDCGKRIIFEYGYITFPLMAASLFAYCGMLALFLRRKENNA